MANDTVTIAMSDVMRGLTLQVRISGLAAATVRFWIGTRLLRLAAWVIGTGFELSTDVTPVRSSNEAST